MEIAGTKKTIREMTAEIALSLETIGYSQKYRQEINRVFRHFAEFSENGGTDCYTAENADKFMLERYGNAFGQTTKNSTVQRAMNLMADYLNFGVVLRRTKEKRDLPIQFAEPFGKCTDEKRREFVAEGTVRNFNESLRKFALFLDKQGVSSPNSITLEKMNEYIKFSLCNYSKQRVAHELRCLRRIMKFLFDNGYVSEDLSGKILNARGATVQKNLPSYFTPEEIVRLLQTVDRSSPVGKRDYAILILAAKLGLRSGDVRGLKFENIDWKNSKITIIQSKTSEPLSLPLLPDVGWALIDYIKNGRPFSSCPEVFVRQVPPHVPMGYYENIMAKHLHAAGISTERVRHHGLHALRHSLATTLLEQNTSLYVIQEVLGQTDPNTTKIYASVDINGLKTCVMEVPEV